MRWRRSTDTTMTESIRKELVLQWRVKSGHGIYYRDWMDSEGGHDVTQLPDDVAKLLAFEMLREWKSHYPATDEEQRVIIRTTTVTEALVLDG